MPAPEHTPGSPEAIAEGCTCDPVANLHGHAEIFECDNNCPVHGLAELKRALEAGDARIIPPKPRARVH
jgi:hypothetical protein